MKIKSIFTTCVLIVLLLGCKDKSDALANIDFCNTTEAVVKSQSKYDTDTGEAFLTILVPKGHQLKKVKQSSTEVRYITKGKTAFDGSYDVKTDKLTGLSNGTSAKLKVYLEIDPTVKDQCKSGPTTKGEKKKTSTIDGVPFNGKILGE